MLFYRSLTPESSATTATSEKSKMQVLVASNSNKPQPIMHSGDRTSVSRKDQDHLNSLQNQTKFKSLGDLHMEKGLPADVPPPRYNHNRKIASRIKGSKDRLVKRLSLYVTENL